jgi:hypothetical protein
MITFDYQGKKYQVSDKAYDAGVAIIKLMDSGQYLTVTQWSETCPPQPIDLNVAKFLAEPREYFRANSQYEID